ncbi:MAG: UDP-N-acetylglucosamine-1-phosphate transferase [Nitrososphaerota archaeon]|nr:UDP-N-acetylglucosamine-1-phosphate transferase [Nitrososphaerota archaeon]
MLEWILPLVALPESYVLSRWLCRYLRGRGMTVPDAHKMGNPQVSRPGGPAIVISLLTPLVILYFLTGSIQIVSFALSVVIAFAVGFVDDLRALSGPVKVGLVVVSALPLLALHTYSVVMPFPFAGHIRLSTIYPVLILIALPVTANAFNMIDVYNGLVSGFTAIATVPLIIDFIFTGQLIPSLMALALLLATAGFYPLHRNPAKLFPGDSGTLALGAAYGAVAIIGHAEFIAVVALLPAVLNSFYVISSVGGLVEHRKMKKRPVVLDKEFKLNAARDPDAPMTLTRMMLADGPLTESEVTRRILYLEAFSASLAILTFFLLGVRI